MSFDEDDLLAFLNWQLFWLLLGDFFNLPVTLASVEFVVFADNDDYEVSWVEFKTEQLENFNWNRMDFYVCTRGDKVSKLIFFVTNGTK